MWFNTKSIYTQSGHSGVNRSFACTLQLVNYIVRSESSATHTQTTFEPGEHPMKYTNQTISMSIHSVIGTRDSECWYLCT